MYVQFFLAQKRKTGSGRDRVKPGAELGRSFKIGQGPDGFYKNILRHFFGILTVATHEIAVLKHPRPKVFDKCIERLQPSLDQRPRERHIRLVVCFHTPIVRTDALGPLPVTVSPARVFCICRCE